MSLIGVGFLRNSLAVATNHPKAPKTVSEAMNPFHTYSRDFHDTSDKGTSGSSRKDGDSGSSYRPK